MKAAEKWGKEVGQRGRLQPPDKVVICGPQGHGKSTLATQWPDVLACDVGRSTSQLDVWCRIKPLPETFGELLDLINYIPEHPVWKKAKSFLLDDVTTIESEFIHPEVVRSYKPERNKEPPSSIGEIPFKNGYALARPLWGKLFAALDRLQSRTEMNVVIVGHTTIANVKNLAGEDYAQVTFDLYSGSNANAGDWLCRWADAVIYLHKEEKVSADGSRKKGKVLSIGELHAVTMPRTWMQQAKNRYGLPDPMHPSYAEYAYHKAAFFNASGSVGEGDPEKLAEMVEALVREVAGWEAPNWRENVFQHHLDVAGKNVDRLRTLYAQLSAKITKHRAEVSASEEQAA